MALTDTNVNSEDNNLDDNHHYYGYYFNGDNVLRVNFMRLISWVYFIFNYS